MCSKNILIKGGDCHMSYVNGEMWSMEVRRCDEMCTLSRLCASKVQECRCEGMELWNLISENKGNTI